MKKQYFILSLLVFVSTAVFAEPFIMSAKETPFYRWKITINGYHVMDADGEVNDVHEKDIGYFLRPGPNQVTVCYTPKESEKLPNAKNISVIKIQSTSQRKIASARRLSNADKYQVYSVAPFGGAFQPNVPICSDYPINIESQQIADYVNDPNRPEWAPPLEGETPQVAEAGGEGNTNSAEELVIAEEAVGDLPGGDRDPAATEEQLRPEQLPPPVEGDPTL